MQTGIPERTFAEQFTPFNLTVSYSRAANGSVRATRGGPESWGAGLTPLGGASLFYREVEARPEISVWDITPALPLPVWIDGRIWHFQRCEVNWAGGLRDGASETYDANGKYSEEAPVATLCAHYEYKLDWIRIILSL